MLDQCIGEAFRLSGASMSGPRLKEDEHGTVRCWWSGGAQDYVAYHDDEWAVPMADDVRLFEKICLEGFQSGLSWLTILRKRDNFRKAFAEFDHHRIARSAAMV